jgi:spermidine synthase
MADTFPPLLADQPSVRQTGDLKTLHLSGAMIQSSMNRLQPDALDLEYTRMMMAFLLFNSRPERITMIGLGGGSLAKFCYRALPKTHIDVVEIHPGVIALRNEFHLPADDDRFAVIEGDGAQFVADHPDHADILLVDGYDQAGIPPQLCSPAFYQHCHDHLREGGILVANLHLLHPDHAHYLDAIRDCFGASVFEVQDDDLTNSIVFACKGDRFDDMDALSTRRPDHMGKDVWRQLLTTFQVVAATLTLR